MKIVEIAQWLRVCMDLLEDPVCFPLQQLVTPTPGEPMSSSGFLRHLLSWAHTTPLQKHTNTMYMTTVKARRLAIL